MSTAKSHLFIIGAGGHGKVAADCAEAMQEFETIVFFDGKYPEISSCSNWSVVGNTNYDDLEQRNTQYFVAVGNNETRRNIQSKLVLAGKNIATLIHPSAVLGSNVSIGVGSLICAGVTINIDSKVGQGSIVNTSASIDHDCNVGEFVHIAPQNAIAGGVNIDDNVFLGIGSTVVQCVSIGRNSIVGAGSTVIKSIESHVTVVGSPAKIVKNHK